MHLGLEEAPNGFSRMAEFYAIRARAGVGLIVTGGVAPNNEGRPFPNGATLTSEAEAEEHTVITEAVHREGGKIALQLLHFGRYAHHSDLVAPSALKAPIVDFAPRELTTDEVEATIGDFVSAAKLAQRAGYDGVEIMGSEGYLINEFLTSATNHRTDEWGGDYENRMRFAIEIVRRIRQAVGPQFILIYRQSMLDLVEDGSTLDEVLMLAQRIEAAGASILNTGIGWHEARIPTIATMVPRGAYAWVTRKVRHVVDIPVVASNRINTPDVAESILADGFADMVSMARPFLADPEFIQKAERGAAHSINTCIGCNQACIDHTFSGKITTCVVNPRACRETELVLSRTVRSKRVAIVGSGPAGLAAATTAAERGHRVTLFEASPEIGGQLNVAKTIPGKDEFYESIRYFADRVHVTGVDLQLNTSVIAQDLRDGGYDHVVLATGVVPRVPDIPGVDHPSVVGYLDVLRNAVPVGTRVAILGAGGIGFDVAKKLTFDADESRDATDSFFRYWGIDPSYRNRGGLTAPPNTRSARQIFLLQRKSTKVGAGLGKTTGWIHRAELKRHGVEMISGVAYDRIDNDGLHITVDGQRRVLVVDTVVLCTGQEPRRELYEDLLSMGVPVHLIGGADVATELDAKRAIRQGTELAASL